jgi:hypothetical protein
MLIYVKLNCQVGSAFRIEQWVGLQEKDFVYKIVLSALLKIPPPPI